MRWCCSAHFYAELEGVAPGGGAAAPGGGAEDGGGAPAGLQPDDHGRGALHLRPRQISAQDTHHVLCEDQGRNNI